MIRINDTSYDARVIVAQDGTMSVNFAGTTQSLSEVQALFDSTPKIEIWEEGELVATYYNKEVTSIEAKKLDTLYNITIYLRVSKLEESEEKVLQTQIDNILEAVDTIKESSVATDNAVDDLGTLSAENQTSIESLASAIDDLATLVAELVESKEDTEDTATETESATTDTKTEEA